jgi:predicted double-glycine peptidase
MPQQKPSKRKTLLKALALTAALLVSYATGALASEAHVTSFGLPADVQVTSYVARKFQSVVHQKYDFSCGSAALATLLTYHYDHPVTEEKVFDAMWAVGDKPNIRAKGFSLLDMKLFLSSIGLEADGYRVPLDKLRQVAVPTIALITRKGYTHFVVLRGIAKDYVVLGDPALGSIIVARKEFETQWNGIAFAIRDAATTARAHFNLKRDLPATAQAFLGLMMSRQSLASVTVLLPPPNEL